LLKGVLDQYRSGEQQVEELLNSAKTSISKVKQAIFAKVSGATAKNRLRRPKSQDEGVSQRKAGKGFLLPRRSAGLRPNVGGLMPTGQRLSKTA
jgi:hypothetical protein